MKSSKLVADLKLLGSLFRCEMLRTKNEFENTLFTAPISSCTLKVGALSLLALVRDMQGTIYIGSLTGTSSCIILKSNIRSCLTK